MSTTESPDVPRRESMTKSVSHEEVLKPTIVPKFNKDKLSDYKCPLANPYSPSESKPDHILREKLKRSISNGTVPKQLDG